MARRGKQDKGKGRRRSRRGENVAPRRRSKYLDGVTRIDTEDHELLRQFVTEHGKIIPARLTRATAGQQRQIKRGVRKARVMGLIP